MLWVPTLGETARPHSERPVDGLQNIKGVPPLKEGLNPATWMLEVSTPGAEQRTGTNFAEIYKDSDFARQVCLLSLPAWWQV